MFTSGSFVVTERCNLACRYCFELGKRKGPDMTGKVAEQGVRMLYAGAVRSGVPKVAVILFGGEPLLKPGICDRILACGYDCQQATGIRFEPSVITNATVLNERVERMLKTAKQVLPGFSCQLSIDGAEKSQNLYRVYPDGRGSFEAASANVAIFRAIFGRDLNIHGCINKQTMPLLYENYRWIAEEWKPGSIWFMPVHTEEWDRADAALYDDQLGKIFEHQTGALNTVSYYSPINKLLSCRPGEERHPGKTCGAGVSFCTITGEGQLWPCHNIYFNDPDRTQRCGNVWDGVTRPEVLKPYEEYTVSDMGCGDCRNTACYRCIADNWATSGSITEQVGRPVRCLLSAVEKKWQDRARQYADEHYRRTIK